MANSNTTLSDIAKILNLIANPPNLRPDSQGEVFDGGKLFVVPGTTRWEFTNGVKAYSGSLEYYNLIIEFPDGLRVNIYGKSD